MSRCSQNEAPNWIQVATYLNSVMKGGDAVTNDQCRQRWKYYADPKLSMLKDKVDKWTPEEVSYHEYGISVSVG